MLEKYQNRDTPKDSSEPTIYDELKEIADSVNSESKESAAEIISIDSIGKKIKEQLEMNANLTDEERFSRLQDHPQLSSRQLNEVIGHSQSEPSSFSWVDIGKIVGRPNLETDGWAHEYDDRQGRISDVAQEIRSDSADNIDRVFHPDKSSERIKLYEINGPDGPMYCMKDGTHRVSGSILAGLESVPAEIYKTEYPIELVVKDGMELSELKEQADLGLIEGEFTTKLDKDGREYKIFTIKDEVVPWIRSKPYKRERISTVYEGIYPGSLDKLGIPKEVLTDQVAYNYFVAGRFDEWIAINQSRK